MNVKINLQLYCVRNNFLIAVRVVSLTHMKVPDENPEEKKKRIHREYMRMKRTEEKQEMTEMEQMVCDLFLYF
jgi:hypothetical protein